ncbi:hypothetical protein [Streptomyces sp. NPDC059761]|uniref:hypothetical protein n=1 Tax=Streptomyces sp. NPDC059761 TaxID=3346937 RepID=UPI0036600DA6
MGRLRLILFGVAAGALDGPDGGFLPGVAEEHDGVTGSVCPHWLAAVSTIEPPSVTACLRALEDGTVGSVGSAAWALPTDRLEFGEMRALWDAVLGARDAGPRPDPGPKLLRTAEGPGSFEDPGLSEQ